jgi:fructokinase
MQASGDPTTLAIVHPGDGEPTFSIYTGGTSALALTVDDLPSEIPDRVRVIHVGSFSLLSDPIASALETFVERHGRNRIVTVDPNIRSRLIADREKALERLEQWTARADIIKASAADVAWPIQTPTPRPLHSAG